MTDHFGVPGSEESRILRISGLKSGRFPINWDELVTLDIHMDGAKEVRKQ